jgi:parallel beta-helix repeat protein
MAPPPAAPRRIRATFRPQVEWLECRRVLATLLVSPTGYFGTTPTPFTTIQSAVDVADAGDTIVVGPGTYGEQVLITKSGLGLTSSVPGAAIVQAPENNALVGNAAVVDIQGATNIVLDGFTIMGPGPSAIPVAGLLFGVYVENSAAVTIQNNHVTQITDNPPGGSPSGVGIEVGLSPGSASALGLASSTGSAQITNNSVDTYQQAGIVVDNQGSWANVQGNVVTGTPNYFLAQDGIEVSNGAVGVVQSNTVSSNVFTDNRATEAAGILLSSPGAGVQVLGNTVQFNDAGIVVQGALNPVLSGNSIGLSMLDGIQLETGTTAALVTSNVSTGNGLDGIYVYLGADSNTIINNTTTFNAEDGIQLIQSSGNVVQGNTACQNARYGISQFLSAGQTNSLSSNTVYGNGIADLFP